MTDPIIIDGKTIAASLREDIANEVAAMDVTPGLAVILVGDDAASQVYVRNKIRACEKAGIKSFEARLPEKAKQAEVTAEIQAFNDNPNVHGILLQLPVPEHLDADALIQMIDPRKDVDGLTFINQGKLVAGDKSGLVPCTPQGSLMLIKSVEENLSGKKALVIGRSLLFGKPMAQLLLAENCTLLQAHSRTSQDDLIALCKTSDIVIAAAGQPKMVQGDWLKPGAIVIDVGINRVEPKPGTVTFSDAEKGKPSSNTLEKVTVPRLVGDVDYEAALPQVRAITPVPGGVGPMTIACLLKNTVNATQNFKTP